MVNYNTRLSVLVCSNFVRNCPFTASHATFDACWRDKLKGGLCGTSSAAAVW